MAVGAEVSPHRWYGVVDVVRVGEAVVVVVASEDPPTAGDELERADRPVPDGVAIPSAVVGVRNAGGAVRAIEWDSDDRRLDGSVESEDCSAEPAVV